MKISTNTLKFINQHYGSAGDPAPDGVNALVEKIGAQLGAVEEVVDFGKKYESVLVVKIVSCVKHENSDHLNICKIDDGGKAEGIERDENGFVQVVCGAQNVREGLTVAWLPPGSTVPESFDTDEPFVLSARLLRGVVSNGMLASPRELGLGDSHEGILEIIDSDERITPGMTFADACHLHGDHIIDIENKMFTHRPDCFGYLGVAREIEGISHRAYKSPEWYALKPTFPGLEADELKIEVRNELPALVPRFMTVTMRDVTVKTSPLWLQVDLARAGVRSINNIVDYTNFFMLETGQPLHAYDYDKVLALDSGADHATLVVRNPRPGEKIVLLNGKQIEPRAEAIMIATNDKLVGVGGVMGGADTEVDENTKNIILECATFDMYSIRRTSMTHGLFTDAVTRNNKGQSPLQNAAVLAKVVDEIRRFADGKVASQFVDDNHLDAAVQERGSLFAPVKISDEFINVRLGLHLSTQEIATLLTNVEFQVDLEGGDLTVTAPFWRTDIEIPEDIVEEVGRLYGFDHLPKELPRRDLSPVTKDALLELKKEIRNILSAAGANEVLSYSFVHGNLLRKAGQDSTQAFQLSNAISPDLQYYRLSLTPSLLDKVHANIKSGYDRFGLFEMGKSHNLMHAADNEGLPTEFNMLAAVYATNDTKADKQSGAAFYQARTQLTFLADRLGVELTFEPIATEPQIPVAQPFDHTRSAFVKVKGGNTSLGLIGEYKTSVRKALKPPQHAAGFEIDLLDLLAARSDGSGYMQLPRFPKVEQDICLKVPTTKTYAEVYDFVEAKLTEVQPENTLPVLSPVDIYQRPDDQDHKQITLRLSIAHFDKTMTDTEVSKMLDHVAEAAAHDLQAERI